LTVTRAGIAEMRHQRVTRNARRTANSPISIAVRAVHADRSTAQPLNLLGELLCAFIDISKKGVVICGEWSLFGDSIPGSGLIDGIVKPGHRRRGRSKSIRPTSMSPCGAGNATPARVPSLPSQVRPSIPSRNSTPPHQQLLDQASAKPPDARERLSPAVAAETRLERIEWSSPPMIGPATVSPNC